MVYFVGHCILLNEIWIPLTNVPVDLVNLGQDQSNRFLDRKELSLQLLCCIILLLKQPLLKSFRGHLERS